MKRITLLIALLTYTLVAFAQSDTVTIGRVKALPQVVALPPFLADSTDLKGTAYDLKSQLSTLPSTRMDNPLLTELVANSKGYFHTDSTLSNNRQTITTYYATLLSPGFEKGTLIMESDSPFALFLDAVEVATSKEGGSRQYSFSLLPGIAHRVAIRLLSKSGGATNWRLRMVPANEKSEITISTTDSEYMNMQYMRTGKNISDVSVSPSGRYTKLVLKEQVNTKGVYSVLLYDGNRLIARLDGSYLQTQWMPKQDKLWWAKQSDTGKQLLLLDPATLQVEQLAPSIPDKGNFMMAPTEDKLIYMITRKGPKSSNKLERVLGRYDTNDGYRNRTFLAMFNLKSGLYRPLTYGYRGTSMQSLSPDGQRMIFSTSRPTTEIPFSETDFLEMNLETLQVDTLFSADKELSALYYTSNPRYLLVLANANAFGSIGRNLPDGAVVNTYDMQLFLYDRQSNTAKALTKEFNPSVQSVKVLPDRFEALFSAEDRDYVSLYRLNLQSGAITRLPTTEEVIRRFDTDRAGRTIAYGGQSVNNSDRFYRITSRGEQLVYDLAKDKMKDLELGSVADWSFRMPNGDEVPGRYYLPPHFDPSRKYPMIVYYYGGTSPTARTFEGSYSLPMYAAQGYVVLTLNPSGTTGWGQEYASRHINAWGKRTADEIIAAVKGFCQEHTYVNAKRIGCVGASYGGFMTQYLQTVTDLFAAAVSHAGISSIASYWGEGTWGIGYSTVASHGSYPWNNPKLYTEQSPLYNADKINTPLLLLHGTADVNVPIGESVQMYNALKILGKEVEFIKVFGEDHGIYEPEKRLLWMQSTMAWFQKWLKDDPTWWDTLYPTIHL